MKYVIHNEVLLITSPTKAESDEFMTTKVYPVADLVLPIQNNMMSGFGGMMGGMGGGMMGGMGGGMGGGMMGGMGGMGGGMGGMGGGMMGGMGGMGGGMGGMGGGMGGMGGMGGGFLNVPREIIPAQNQGPRFFAVQPETVAIASTAKPAAAKPDSIGADPKPAVALVDPIHLDIAPGARHRSGLGEVLRRARNEARRRQASQAQRRGIQSHRATARPPAAGGLGNSPAA